MIGTPREQWDRVNSFDILKENIKVIGTVPLFPMSQWWPLSPTYVSDSPSL